MAYAERKTVTNKHPWTLPKLAGTDEITRSIGRPPTGDSTTSAAAKTMGRAELARRKNDYFEEAFSIRNDGNPLRERIRGDSTVLMEVKTNVIVSLPQPRLLSGLISERLQRGGTDAAQIGDEFIFITELSAKLAERYQRPLSSIAVHVSHSQCIFYAGTFEPAYIATLSALAPYVQPATNRRNAHVLSEHLEEALGVSAPRGLITFVALPEENIVCNGKTMAQALEEAEGSGSHAMGAIEEERTPSSVSRRKRLSVKVGKGLCEISLKQRYANPKNSRFRTLGQRRRWQPLVLLAR